MTTIYSLISDWSHKQRAIVKCDECGKTNGIDILDGTTAQQNRVALEDQLIQCGWDVEFTYEGHCLCPQHKEEK